MNKAFEAIYKYQGLGNDFVILDRRKGGGDIDARCARNLCDRHLGVGADGVLVLLEASDADVRVVIHNPDGSIAENCGNGVRCVARHLAEKNLGTRLRIRTGSETLLCTMEPRQGRAITVEMGAPRLTDVSLPNGGPFVEKPLHGRSVTAVSLGNPHCVVLDARGNDADILGPRIERDALFPASTNVAFPQLQVDGSVELVVWERGAGRTLACGTGACAAITALAMANRVPWDTWIQVRLPGGPLDVKIAYGLEQAWIRGPAELVFRGEIVLADIASSQPLGSRGT